MSLFVRRKKPPGRKVTIFNGKRKKTIIRRDADNEIRCPPLATSISCPANDPDYACNQDQDLSYDEAQEEPINGKSGKSVHRKRKEATINGWSSIRGAILDVMIELNAPSSHLCSLCDMSISKIIRCEDCGPSAFYCSQCCDRIHTTLFLHFSEIWQDGIFIPYYQVNNIIKRSDHNCESCYEKSITAFDSKGRQHEITFLFCLTEKEAVTLARHRLWPATPINPQVAFHFDLLEWSTVLMLECQVPLKGFCEAVQMRQKNGFQKAFRIKEMYRVLVNEAAAEYRHSRFENNTLRRVCPQLDDGQACPACPISTEETSQPRIYSVDADFQLVRKYSSGYSYREPRHQNSFFANQSEVDRYIESYGSDTVDSTSQVCHNFQAGDRLRAKGKNKKLDETALFGSACRHEYPKLFFNLKHGERLAYSVYLLEKLHQENTSHIYYMYDIACKLEAHLQKKTNKEAIISNTTFCIPIFHAYGHKYQCQVLYGPRYTQGIGLTDGETMERLWSYIGRFKKITKEMTPENRHDLLTDGLFYYAQKIHNKIGDCLVNKMIKAHNILSKTETEFQTFLNTSEIQPDCVPMWLQNEKLNAKERRHLHILDPLTKEEEYAAILEKKYIDSTVQLSDLQERELHKKEKQLKIIKRWLPTDYMYLRNITSGKKKKLAAFLHDLQKCITEKKFLYNLLKKHSDGQAVAIRILRQVTKADEKLRGLVKKYNQNMGQQMGLPTPLTVEDVYKEDSTFWAATREITDTIRLTHEQLKSMEFYSYIERSKEEISLVQAEMHNVFNFFLKQHSIALQSANSAVGKGASAALKMKTVAIEYSLFEFRDKFCNYVELPDIQGPQLISNSINFTSYDDTTTNSDNSDIEVDSNSYSDVDSNSDSDREFDISEELFDISEELNVDTDSDDIE